MIRKRVGQRIRELRIQSGLSQEKFALEAGLDRTYLATVESGKRNISIVNLAKVWRALSISPIIFFNSPLFYEDYDE